MREKPIEKRERNLGRSLLLTIAVMIAAPFATPTAYAETTANAVTRCGWFQNPSPGNAWLIDKDGEWIVGVQGGHQAEGDWPDFDRVGWISTNRSYGYGCACLAVIVKAQSHDILRIIRSTAQPLKTCVRDKRLPKPLN